MRRWIVVLSGVILALGIALVLLTVAAWLLNTLLHPVLTPERITDISDIVSLGAVVGTVLVGITGAAAIIVRTGIWSSLARALMLWDFAFALAFIWLLARPVVPQVGGPWQRMILTLLLLVIAARRVWVVLRATEPDLPIIAKLAHDTERMATQTRQAIDAVQLESTVNGHGVGGSERG